jgi:hypothetical protein
MLENSTLEVETLTVFLATISVSAKSIFQRDVESSFDIHIFRPSSDMNGRALAEFLSALFPELHCLFMFGYTANVIAHHGVLEEGVHLMQKPFSGNDLANNVRKILDG